MYESMLMSALCENALTSKSGDILFGDLEMRWDSAIIKNSKGDSITIADVRFKMSLDASVSPYSGKISNNFNLEVTHSNGRLMYTHLHNDKDRLELFKILEECLERFTEANKSVNEKVWDILDKV